MKSIRITIVGLFVLVGIIAAINLLHAQETVQGGEVSLTDTNMDWNAMSDLEVELKAIESVPPMPSDSLPTAGTFWSAQHAPGSAEEWPPLPIPLGMSAWSLGGDGVYLLDDLNHVYPVPKLSKNATTTSSGTMMTMDNVDLNPNDGGSTNGGSGGSFSPMFSPGGEFGTNLWVEITNLTDSAADLMVSNTIADVEYEVQSTTNLADAQWNSEGFFFGSEITNWTPTSAEATNWPDLFYRIRSWQSSDGSGLPDWWQLKYFGTTGVDPYADPDGDGWNNLQEFQNGTDPTVFNTPPAPQGVTASLHQTSNSATVSWLPDSGNVTSYTVEKTDLYSYTVQDFTVSASATSYLDDISGDSPDPDNGNNYDVSYQVWANYSNGSSSPLSASVPLQSGTIASWIIPGTNGITYLSVSGLAANAVSVLISSGSFSNNIPASYFTNGLCQLPASWASYLQVYLDSSYVCSVDANGNPSAGSWISPYYLSYFDASGNFMGSELYSAPEWGHAFYDGRVQLKQNLTFLLRAATISNTFGYYPTNLNPAFSVATNYAYSSFNVVGSSANNGIDDEVDEDVLAPFELNYFYRNFVYDSSAFNSYGFVTNGFQFRPGYSLQLLAASAYQFQDGSTNFHALLGTNQMQWLAAGGYLASQNGSDVGIPSNFSMSSNAKNIYGLPFLSAQIAQASSTDLLSLNYLSAGGNVLSNANDFYWFYYPETAQPQYQTVEYDFWAPFDSQYNWNTYSESWQLRAPIDALYAAHNSRYVDTSESWDDLIPGMDGFSPTNKSRLMILPVGRELKIAGYAKMAVANGYSGVYGYLGQYFDKAYQMTNGVVTTNTTGVLSPYGNFFATQGGPAALVTMPDVDTGARGTCMVYCVSMNVDKNHDGNMDLSFSGPDATSQASPDVVWANNNYDRFKWDADDATNYEDDLGPVDIAKLPSYQQVPDCNYANAYGQPAIPSTRDLEDYFRLRLSGISDLMRVLPSNYTVQLTLSGSGQIRIFQAVEPNGGTNYLSDETTASNQVANSTSLYVGLLTSSSPIVFNISTNFNEHFIFCGAQTGAAQIDLQVLDASQNVVADAPAYMQINDIKQMYERWTVGESPNTAPKSVATWQVDNLAFQYPQNTDTNTPYILFVHGWNLETWEKDRFAETAFKRLYWQGYQGRLGEFRWPTDFGFTGTFDQLATDPQEKDNFDNSEYNAWLSGTGLLNKLEDLNAEYPGHVYILAHSMGNVVVSEALRLAGTNQVVNTYVASQAAVTAHTYDPTVANYSFERSIPVFGTVINFNLGPNTPNIYGNWFAGNYGGGAGRVVNFYNVNDYALSPSSWQLDQLFKPDVLVAQAGSLWAYGYSGSTNDPSPWNHFYKTNLLAGGTINFDIVGSLTNRYEVMSHAAQSYTTALGATPGVHNVTANVDLTTLWPTDPTGNDYVEHFWHSAEFRGDYTPMQGYWSDLLGSGAFNLK